MIFKHSKDNSEGVAEASNLVGMSLKDGKNVLLVVCGGSNIDTVVKILDTIKSFVSKQDLKKLTITLSDERYGEVGHKDSNWKQLIDAGLDVSNINSIPVLSGLPVEETTDSWSFNLKKAYNKADIIVGILGIGTDGHIAGVLPETLGVSDSRVAVNYNADPYIRITMTLKMIRKMSVVFAFVFGDKKKDVLSKLKGETLPTDQMPAQILRSVKDVRVYC